MQYGSKATCLRIFICRPHADMSSLSHKIGFSFSAKDHKEKLSMLSLYLLKSSFCRCARRTADLTSTTVLSRVRRVSRFAHKMLCIERLYQFLVDIMFAWDHFVVLPLSYSVFCLRILEWMLFLVPVKTSRYHQCLPVWGQRLRIFIWSIHLQ